MKRIAILFLIMALNITLCSCGTPNDIIKGTGADVINSEASISLEGFNKIAILFIIDSQNIIYHLNGITIKCHQ